MNKQAGCGIAIVMLFALTLIVSLLDNRSKRTKVQTKEPTEEQDVITNTQPSQALTAGIESKSAYPRKGGPLSVVSIKPSYRRLYEVTLNDPSNTNAGVVVAFSGYKFKLGDTAYATTVTCRFAKNVPPVPILFANPERELGTVIAHR